MWECNKMTEHHGAYVDYGPQAARVKFLAGTSSTETQQVTILTGQVLKKHSLIITNAAGKGIAHTGMSEKAVVTFADIITGKTVILGGLTFTSSAGVAKAVLVAAFKNLTSGMTAAQANAANPVTGGSFTSGTLGSWNTYLSSTADSVVFVSTAPNTNPTDIADTGNGSGATVVVTAVSSPLPVVKGMLAMDVDASGGDVVAPVFTEGNFWDSVIVWGVDISTDTITLDDFTTKAVTEYNTGAFTAAAQDKLLENGEIRVTIRPTAGEVY
jgi:hypothetical protein